MADDMNNDKGGMTVEEAGRKGGEKTAATHGSEFYRDIAKKRGRGGEEETESGAAKEDSL